MSTRIPKKIWLPGNEEGFTIHVKQISADEMQKRHGPVDGIWDDSTNTIWLRKYMSKERKFYVFGHEFVHAVTDWNHWMANSGIAKA